MEDQSKGIVYIIGQDLHTVSIHDGSGNIDLSQIREANADLMEKKKELCEKIFHLGIGLTGDPSKAVGFLMGWLTRSIKTTREKKDATSWNINHSKEELSNEELSNELATLYESLAALIREKGSSKIGEHNPLIKGLGNDGTDLF